jgi:hypothetical protein
MPGDKDPAGARHHSAGVEVLKHQKIHGAAYTLTLIWRSAPLKAPRQIPAIIQTNPRSIYQNELKN